MMMRFGTSPLATALLVVLAAYSCVGCRAVPIKRFYTLVNEVSPPTPVPAQPVCERSVVVTAVDALEPYDQDRLVFRTGDYEVKNYNYRVWVAPPPELLRKLVQEKVERTDLFGAVDPYIDAAVDHLLLTIQIKAIEEVLDDETSSARFAAAFQLKDPQSEKTLWRHEFDSRLPLPGDEVSELMAGLSRVYNEQTDATLESLRGFLRSYERCGRTP